MHWLEPSSLHMQTIWLCLSVCLQEQAERTQRALSPQGPGMPRGLGEGCSKAHGQSRGPPSPLAFPSRPRATPPWRKCARRGPAVAYLGPSDPQSDVVSTLNELRPASQFFCPRNFLLPELPDCQSEPVGETTRL